MKLPQASRRRLAVWAVVAAFLVGALGGAATEIGPWYRGLVKPSWQPPDWLFGPVWTTIYVLVTTAGLRAAYAAPDATARRQIGAAFVVNAFFNVLWSLCFFAWRRPDWALIEVVFLWLSIVALIFVLRRHDKLAGWLSVPYLVWVSFAAFLNFTIVRLNSPFGGVGGA